MKALMGTGVALITPFDKNGEIDFDALKSLVEFQITNGINYLVVLGTTGESVTLSKPEKHAVINCVIAANANRLPLVLGVGGNNTASVCEELKDTDLNAFDAILSVSPYYNKPTQEGIYAHFAAIAKVSPKPIILYNVPGRTSSNMQPETVKRLAQDFENIVAIKEAAGDMPQALELIRQVPKDFLVISGDDMIALAMTLAGGAGVISVIAQGLPEQFSKLIQLGLEGKAKEAYAIHYPIMTSIDMIFEEGNPAGIKTLLESLGLCTDMVRLPLLSASPDLKNRIHAFLKKNASLAS